MPILTREHRRILENSVAGARRIAEAGAESALKSLAVDKADFHSTMSPDERRLRLRLRAHGRQIGDTRDRQTGTQTILHLTQACAYEQWHRMLFARFLAENGLLLDSEHYLSLSMDDVKERARGLGKDWLDVASEFAQRMLLDVFRPGDPVLEVALPPEKRQQLETELERMPADIFVANDSLGWVYQFWQKEEKDRVNRSEDKIGADELAPVTQLFTEDYIVLFLLHNTLGAWWAARQGAPTLTGYEWTYLRLNEDGSPASGTFSGWPKRACELRVLDPCMGSGHFLVFALPILARMRMVEENLPIRDAVYAVLRDNLFGLELDARCSQIAAFNVALAAWRIVGEVCPLPSLHLACSGLGINATETEWVKFAGNDSLVRVTMQKLYELFQEAPTLGSLIDPTRVGDLITARFDQAQPLLEKALAQENSGDEALFDEEKELAIAAEGLLAATRILANKFTLIATNVPYLGRGKQDPVLASHCDHFHNDAKADLATCFVDRSLRWCAPGGSIALVTPQNWLFLTSYKNLRERLILEQQLDFVVRLGEHAFQSSSAAGAFAALIGISCRTPSIDHSFAGWDVSSYGTPEEKATGFGNPVDVQQATLRLNPDTRIGLEKGVDESRLLLYANSYLGLGTCDAPHYVVCFWELPSLLSNWQFMLTAADDPDGLAGRERIVRWDCTRNRVFGMTDAERTQGHNQDYRGSSAWGRLGISVSLVRNLRFSLYAGDLFDKSIAVLVPKDPDTLPAIAAFCHSGDFTKAVRKLDQKLMVTNATLVKVPFDLTHWQAVAEGQYPNGLPKPNANSPTQWLFDGNPKRSTHPLQVAVARLLGYRWPRQTGSKFPDFTTLGTDGLEQYGSTDGIVCLSALQGQEPAHARLRALLAEAFDQDWSAQRMAELIGDSDSLENWLSKDFFRQHCDVFEARPFVWHVWDGRNDGFHAFLNYHKLAGPNGQGRRTLERLIYTYLGDWIRTQESQIGKVDGADARLVAAQHLRQQLELILKGEPPFDVFVRWKPIHEQAIGWEPDLNDGIRVNIRPWLEAKPYKTSRRDACILRETPIKLPLGKDRGKEPFRDPEDFPWFSGAMDRTNDIHLTNAEKQAARARKGRK